MTKIGLIQVLQRDEDGYEKRCDELLYYAEKCFKDGAQLVFFPEAYQHVPRREVIYCKDELKRISEEFKQRCSELVKKYGRYLVPWEYEVCDGKVYNASYILNRNGEEIGRYRKVHLTHGEQSKGLTNGDGFPVFELDFGKVGIMICWDNYFPESARCLGNQGAQLVLYPLYGDTLDPQWEIKVRARAIDNSMYIVFEQIDGYNEAAYTGAVGPDGTVLERMTKEPGYRIVEVDLSAPVITHTTGNKAISENIKEMTERCRRPKAYGALMKEPEIKEWNEIFYGNEPYILTESEYLKKK